MGLMDITMMKLPNSEEMGITTDLIGALTELDAKTPYGEPYDVDIALEKLAIAIVDLNIELVKVHQKLRELGG